MIPVRATARLQLHAGFTLHDAADRVPYYAALGVSHLYLSPVGVAVAGSTHGYDAVDPGRVNPALGGAPALWDLGERARAHGMGLVLDIVPNHVAAHHDNPWWWDVLRHGRRSRHARWFDVDWDAPGRHGRLWLPVLDRELEEVIAAGTLVPGIDGDGGCILEHNGQRFPLQLEESAELPAEAGACLGEVQAMVQAAQEGDDRLHRLLEAQPYRLAWWRRAPEVINYRRFFDINALAALRMEEPAAFAAVHALPLRLVEAGILDGLRIDHVDGLADPRGYLRRLRTRLDRAGRRRGPGRGRPLLVVEKILAHDEALPADWACDGTTGYDFMDQVGGLLHDPAGEPVLRRLWQDASGRSGDFAAEERAARDEILAGSLQPEFERAVRGLVEDVGGAVPRARLAAALAAAMREFPVYRTYARRDGLDARDGALFAAAVARARASADTQVQADLEVLDARMVDAPGLPARVRLRRRRLRQRIEQLSAPLNAKSVEDTAFYRHGVLLSRNEVGSDPARFALDVDAFHAACTHRAARHPRALLITASHDHKRGEDVRARLAVLSARADWWQVQVGEFEALATPLLAADDAPSPGDRLMLWQTLVAAWPLQLQAGDDDGLRAFAGRVDAWLTKAIREAKLRTSWTDPDDAYESACSALVEAVLVSPEGRGVRDTLCAAAGSIGAAGAANGLAQLVLRLTVPGIPDLYQGTEDWDLSLVDPDNRRPVDYATRERWLDDTADLPSLVASWRDGRLKARILHRLLALRQERPALFAEGGYRPLVLAADGVDLVAFERRHAGAGIVVVVPRLTGVALADAPVPLPAADDWHQARIGLPEGAWQDVLGAGRQHQGAVALSDLFADCPVAVLATDTGPP